MNNNQNTNNNQNQQQNQQQGSLLRRAANNNNANANQNQQPNQVANQQQNNLNNNQNNNNNNNNPFRSRFGNNNNNRFGNNNQPAKPTWIITPMSEAGVKFAFQGIGDPLFRILGTPLDKSLGDVNYFADKVAAYDDIRKQLIDKLDEAWETYNFQGAAILHPVRKNIQEAFTMQTLPIAEPQQQNNQNNNNPDNNNQVAPPPQFPFGSPKSPYESYRAVDATLVLNIIGRVRGSVLVEDTPLALEAAFLNQVYICDDPRIVELALATGAIEEAW